MNLSLKSLYREPTKKDQKAIWLYILLFTSIIIITSIIFIPITWPIGFLVWLLIIVGGGLFYLVRWHSKNTAYHCPNCHNEFEISGWEDFISPHAIDKKYLKCPYCGKRKWAKVLMKGKK